MTELDWLKCDNPHLMLDHLTQTKIASKWSLLSWFGLRREQPDTRKLLLFAIACCRRIEHLLVDERSHYALAVAEKIADGQAGRRDRRRAALAANAAAFDASSPTLGVGGWRAAAQARAAEAVVAALLEQDLANVAAARAKEAMRTLAKSKPASNPGFTLPPASKLEFSWNPTLIVAAPTESVFNPEEAAWTTEAKAQCEYLRDIFGNPFQPVTLKRQALPNAEAIALAKTIYAERTFARVPEIADILSNAGVDDPAILAHCRQPGEHVRGCWVIDLLLGGVATALAADLGTMKS